MTPSAVYVGRFAPSPTGPLHFGSLVAALASFLDARHAGGRWLLRIEDIDPLRESLSAPATIIDQLLSFGLRFDGEVLFQSTRRDAYTAALEQLKAHGLLYPCVCSRQIAPPVYDGRCRSRTFPEPADHAVRLRIRAESVSWDDRIAGRQSWRLDEAVGDFIVRRKDGLDAYHLAVVVDDAFQGITDVVRGNDLLDSTPKHIYLQACLNIAQPRWCHFPVVLGKDGHKLSKQNLAPAIDTCDPLPQLKQALRVLNQPLCEEATRVEELLDQAIANWDITRITHRHGVPLP